MATRPCLLRALRRPVAVGREPWRGVVFPRRSSSSAAADPPSPSAPLVSNIDRINALGLPIFRRQLYGCRRLSALADQKVAAHHAPDRLGGLSFWADLRPGYNIPRNVPQLHAAAAQTEAAAQMPTTRRMKETFVEFELPFESDKSLLEIYGDFDTLAGTIAYKHCLPDGAGRADAHRIGLYLVTAAVDRLDMIRPLDPRQPENLRLSGFVCSTTNSTLEVLIRMESVSPRLGLQDRPETLLLGRFTMACRDAETGKKREIPQIVAGDADEEALVRMSKDLRTRKRQEATRSLASTPPTAKESAILHRVFTQRTEGGALPPRGVWMSDTLAIHETICHPQERNVHGKIFGGFLMRLSHETAWATACKFAQSPTRFLALDELNFKAPVEIGSLLTLRSIISFAPIEEGHKSFQVAVEASTTSLSTGERVVTNEFHYTFTTDDGASLKRYVLPRTYNEGMEWLEAMRRRETGLALRRMYDLL